MNTQFYGSQALLTIALITAMLWAPLPLQAATNIKLSGAMPAFGDVSSFQISRDGRYAVYLADQDTDEVPELYSVLLGGGPPVRLNPILPPGRAVASFQISPDSRRVVYRADQDSVNVVELYSVPIGGLAASIKLNGTLGINDDVIDFQISPDSSRVVFLADHDTIFFNVVELYSVPIEGPVTAVKKLNKTLVANGNVAGFRISPDSNWVVYGADQDKDGATELYSVPIGGPDSDGLKLNKGLVLNGSVKEGLISPDSSRVVFLADQDTVGVQELYSVPIRGLPSAGLKLNEALVPGRNVDVFKISPNGGRVVYIADQETNSVHELYSVPIGGPADAGIKLNKALTPNGDVSDFQISPDSSRVVYLADQDNVGFLELYSVPLAGPNASGVKLNGTLVALGKVFFGFQISPDSGRVLYIADQDIAGVLELYMTSNFFLYLPLLLR
jgi:Tol biopolymer transport system component